MKESNFPLVASKPYAGTLKTGQHYLVGNWPLREGDDRDRTCLAVAATDRDGAAFRKAWVVRSGRPPRLRWPGRAKTEQWSYPFALEHAGSLYVIYTINKEDCGLAIIPLDALAVS